jgi:hypothetical protein
MVKTDDSLDNIYVHIYLIIVQLKWIIIIVEEIHAKKISEK